MLNSWEDLDAQNTATDLIKPPTSGFPALIPADTRKRNRT